MTDRPVGGPGGGVRGRWAPSPTGDIHLGNARTALAAWLSCRAADGVFVWRLEDLDLPRVVEGVAERQMADLRWLGLDWDEGPDLGGPHGPYRQSERDELYREALRRLDAGGLVFPCDLTRRDLQEVASAPHGGVDSPYPPSLRPGDLPPGWLGRLLATGGTQSSVRLRVDGGPTSYRDRIRGELHEDLRRTVGDFVLRRRDGLWAYQLAVVVDDADQRITEIVRGADLLSSTGRQVYLQRCLELPEPAYLHVPLVFDEGGEKLSKRHESLTLESLRRAGWPAVTVVGQLAASLGLLDRPRDATPTELLEHWDPDRLRGEDVVVAPETLAGGPSGHAPPVWLRPILRRAADVEGAAADATAGAGGGSPG